MNYTVANTVLRKGFVVLSVKVEVVKDFPQGTIVWDVPKLPLKLLITIRLFKVIRWRIGLK